MAASGLRFCGMFWLGVLTAHQLFAGSINLTNLQTISIPFGQFANQVAINDHGDIAGTSVNNGTDTGFLIPLNQNAIQIQHSNAFDTYVNGINNQDTLVGDYFGFDNVTHGFSYSGGNYTPIKAGLFTYPFGINNRGDVTGYYSNSQFGDTATGFLIRNGITTTFYVPGHPFDTFATAVNDSDQVVGYYNGATSGFLRQSNGSFKTFDFLALDINDSGIIVGDKAGTNDNSLGLIRIGGTEYTFTFPGAVDTYITGINNEVEVVGSYLDANFVDHIFEGQIPTAVPEPSMEALCGLLLITGSAFACRRRRSTAVLK